MQREEEAHYAATAGLHHHHPQHSAFSGQKGLTPADEEPYDDEEEDEYDSQDAYDEDEEDDEMVSQIVLTVQFSLWFEISC